LTGWEAKPSDPERALSGFSDGASISPWARNAVAEMSQAGIVSGMGDGRFAPAEHATRAQAAAMLVRFLQTVRFIDE